MVTTLQPGGLCYHYMLSLHVTTACSQARERGGRETPESYYTGTRRRTMLLLHVTTAGSQARER